MAFLPVFVLGFLIGMLVNSTYDTYKKEIPSNTRLHMLEAKIVQLNVDIKNLTERNLELENELLKEKTK